MRRTTAMRDWDVLLRGIGVTLPTPAELGSSCTVRCYEDVDCPASLPCCEYGFDFIKTCMAAASCT